MFKYFDKYAADVFKNCSFFFFFSFLACAPPDDRFHSDASRFPDSDEEESDDDDTGGHVSKAVDSKAPRVIIPTMKVNTKAKMKGKGRGKTDDVPFLGDYWHEGLQRIPDPALLAVHDLRNMYRVAMRQRWGKWRVFFVHTHR